MATRLARDGVDALLVGFLTNLAGGFAGVLVMVRPGQDAFDTVALVAIFGACAFALANVLIRVMARTEPPNRILFYYHAGGALVFAVPAAWAWTTPVGLEWLLLFLIGVFTTIGMISWASETPGLATRVRDIMSVSMRWIVSSKQVAVDGRPQREMPSGQRLS